MKKILIIMPSMFIGGAERSLLGLLENIDYSEYEVSLFLYRHEGEFLQYIPEQVNILPEMDAYRTFDVPIRSLLFSRKICFGVARILGKIAQQIHCKVSSEKSGVWMSMQYISAFLQPLLPSIPGHYDLGIMYLGIADTLVNKVDAKVKMTWNHTDYETLFPDRKKDLKTYSGVNAIVSVSETCTNKFKQFYPELSDKAITIENCLARKLIARQADCSVTDISVPSGALLFLSIGRFCEAKNFDNIPEIAYRLTEYGNKFVWYIIGYGGDEELIRQKIKEFHMEDHVVILGKKDNPYPYIRLCDLYIQPSRYEGKCVSVIEAQVLGKPVVITRYETSSSQLEDGIDGVIVPMNLEKCAQEMDRLLHDQLRMQALRNNCLQRDYSNSKEIEKLVGWIQ